MSNIHSFLRKNILFHRFFFLSEEVIYQVGVAFLVFRLTEAIMADPRGHTPYMIPFIQNIQNRQIRRGQCRSGWFPEAVGKWSMKARLLMDLRSSHRATGTFKMRYKCWLYTSMNVLNATKSHVEWLFLSFVNCAG